MKPFCDGKGGGEPLGDVNTPSVPRPTAFPGTGAASAAATELAIVSGDAAIAAAAVAKATGDGSGDTGRPGGVS